MEKEVLEELAKAFRKEEEKFRYGKDNSSKERFFVMVSLLANLLDKLSCVDCGTVSHIARVVAHYAATSDDHDKKEVVKKLVMPDGVCGVLEYVEACDETVGIWAGVLEHLADMLEQDV